MGDYQVSGGICCPNRFIWGVITRKLKPKSLPNWIYQTAYICVIQIRISGGSRRTRKRNFGLWESPGTWLIVRTGYSRKVLRHVVNSWWKIRSIHTPAYKNNIPLCQSDSSLIRHWQKKNKPAQCHRPWSLKATDYCCKMHVMQQRNKMNRKLDKTYIGRYIHKGPERKCNCEERKG